MGVVDWDDPASWLRDEGVEAVERLCRDGQADVPVYDMARDGRVGHHRLTLDGASFFVAEGIFAQEIVGDCARLGVLAGAICLSNRPVVTFWRRLTRDLLERRKPALVLLRRGLMLLRRESRVVAHAVRLGCEPMTVEAAYQRVRTCMDAASPRPAAGPRAGRPARTTPDPAPDTTPDTRHGSGKDGTA